MKAQDFEIKHPQTAAYRGCEAIQRFREAVGSKKIGKYRLETFKQGLKRYVLVRWGYIDKDGIDNRGSRYLGDQEIVVRALDTIRDELCLSARADLERMAVKIGVMGHRYIGVEELCKLKPGELLDRWKKEQTVKIMASGGRSFPLITWDDMDRGFENMTEAELNVMKFTKRRYLSLAPISGISLYE